MKCARCAHPAPPGPYGRRDTCSRCGADLRSCVNCAFYAPGHYNHCREPQAERVLDAERANFCDYFRPAEEVEGAPREDPRAAAKARLDALFKKA